MKELHEKAQKHTFQAEVDRMMKLIINSLYKNKEVGNLSEVLVILISMNKDYCHFKFTIVFCLDFLEGVDLKCFRCIR